MQSWRLDQVVRGYLEAAAFADLPEGSKARGSKEARIEARCRCYAFLRHAGDLIQLALDQPGYDPVQLGRDLWFSSSGHGTGFWDRNELLSAQLLIPAPAGLDRDGKAYDLQAVNLGDALHALAYGPGGTISIHAFPTLYTAGGHFYID